MLFKDAEGNPGQVLSHFSPGQAFHGRPYGEILNHGKNKAGRSFWTRFKDQNLSEPFFREWYGFLADKDSTFKIRIGKRTFLDDFKNVSSPNPLIQTQVKIDNRKLADELGQVLCRSNTAR